MAKQVFVSHAVEDLDLVEDLLLSIQHLPFNLYIAVNEPETGRIPSTIANQIENADAIIPVLTRNSTNSQWVNQEIGYAQASYDVTPIPIYEEQDLLGGFLDNVKGVKLDRYNRDRTTFEIISTLRKEFEPLGLTTPNWFVEVNCDYGRCEQVNRWTIDRSQEELWDMHEENNTIYWNCRNCGTEYHFEPATLKFIKTQEPQ